MKATNVFVTMNITEPRHQIQYLTGAFALRNPWTQLPLDINSGSTVPGT